MPFAERRLKKPFVAEPSIGYLTPREGNDISPVSVHVLVISHEWGQSTLTAVITTLLPHIRSVP